MTISILRTNDAWWVQAPTGAAKITATTATTGELLADRTAIDSAVHSADIVSGNRAELPVVTDDTTIDLDTQRNAVRYV